MKRMTKEELERRSKVIKKFCKKYRTEITVLQALAAKFAGIAKPDDYIQFMNGLSFGEFVGNNYWSLTQSGTVNMMEHILNGVNTFADLVEDSVVDIKEFNRLLRKVQKEEES